MVNGKHSHSYCRIAGCIREVAGVSGWRNTCKDEPERSVIAWQMTDNQIYAIWWFNLISHVPRATCTFLSRIFFSLHFKSEKGREDVCITCLLLMRQHSICVVNMKNKIKFLPLIDFLPSTCFGVSWWFNTLLAPPEAQPISTLQYTQWNLFS